MTQQQGRKLAELTAEGCAGFMAAEGAVLNYLKEHAGRVTTAGYIAARDECKRQMGELGKRLRAKAPAVRG